MNKQNIAEREAFSKLYEAYAPMVYRRCVFMLKDEAEAGDMMQDVFLRIFSRRDSLDLSAPFQPALEYGHKALPQSDS